MTTEATLWVIGMPLDESGEISAPATAALTEATVIIGENRKVALRYLKDVPGARAKTDGIFFMDPYRKEEMQAIDCALRQCAAAGGTAALFSDCGMPILFDPGVEVLEMAKRAGFVVRSIAGPTSWGTACALTGWAPPFLVLGFLPRDTPDRVRELARLKGEKGHAVLMDTPYRFKLTLKGAREACGANAQAFLAWEISKPGERLMWGSLAELERRTEKLGMEKGEFVLILKGDGKIRSGEHRGAERGR